MYNHEPKDYKCPFCRIVKGIEDKFVITKQKDIFYKDKNITAFIASHWWPNNKGHVIIIPNNHIENLYDLPDYLSNEVHSFEKRVAIALKKIYKCDGISSRQHNEPEGCQDVWHYHLHVFPRYKGDKLYFLNDQKKQSQEEDRLLFSLKLKNYFENIK